MRAAVGTGRRANRAEAVLSRSPLPLLWSLSLSSLSRCVCVCVYARACGVWLTVAPRRACPCGGRRPSTPPRASPRRPGQAAATAGSTAASVRSARWCRQGEARRTWPRSCSGRPSLRGVRAERRRPRLHACSCTRTLSLSLRFSLSLAPQLPPSKSRLPFACSRFKTLRRGRALTRARSEGPSESAGAEGGSARLAALVIRASNIVEKKK